MAGQHLQLHCFFFFPLFEFSMAGTIFFYVCVIVANISWQMWMLWPNWEFCIGHYDFFFCECVYLVCLFVHCSCETLPEHPVWVRTRVGSEGQTVSEQSLSSATPRYGVFPAISLILLHFPLFLPC